MEAALLAPIKNRGLAPSNVLTILYNFIGKRGQNW